MSPLSKRRNRKSDKTVKDNKERCTKTVEKGAKPDIAFKSVSVNLVNRVDSTMAGKAR